MAVEVYKEEERDNEACSMEGTQVQTTAQENEGNKRGMAFRFKDQPRIFFMTMSGGVKNPSGYILFFDSKQQDETYVLIPFALKSGSVKMMSAQTFTLPQP
ncbi:hypothetical protein YC2023_094192 [Brassica napus]